MKQYALIVAVLMGCGVTSGGDDAANKVDFVLSAAQVTLDPADIHAQVAPAPKAVTLTNTSGSAASYEVTVDDQDNFTVTSSCDALVASGDTCDITVINTATTVGLHESIVRVDGKQATIVSAYGGATLRVDVTGTGAVNAPAIGFSCDQSDAPCRRLITSESFAIQVVGSCFQKWGAICANLNDNNCSLQCAESGAPSCDVNLNGAVIQANGQPGPSFPSLPSGSQFRLSAQFSTCKKREL